MAEIFHPTLDGNKIKTISTLGLAHIGDGVYELLVRTMLVSDGSATSASLHKSTVAWVSATAQAEAAEKIMPRLSEEEIAVYKRGRNAKVGTVPHNTPRAVYMKATGLETLFGWLYLKGENDRITELFAIITEE